MCALPCGDRQATIATAPKGRLAIAHLCEDFQCCLAEPRDAIPRCGGDLLVNLSGTSVGHLLWKGSTRLPIQRLHPSGDEFDRVLPRSRPDRQTEGLAVEQGIFLQIQLPYQ